MFYGILFVKCHNLYNNYFYLNVNSDTICFEKVKIKFVINFLKMPVFLIAGKCFFMFEYTYVVIGNEKLNG